MRLRTKSSQEWQEYVMANFDTFLLDHAACERKASAMAMSLVCHYPDKRDLVDAMTELALEEMTHFKQVVELVHERNLILAPDEKDPYINTLMKLVRNGTEFYFLDRLLLAGVIEARGTERFQCVAEALPDGPLKDFYWDIVRSEARHHALFVRLARRYFDRHAVEKRLDELLDAEGQIIQDIPLRAAVH